MVKDGSDASKVAGACAIRIREGSDVALLAKGGQAVLHTVRAIHIANQYLADEGIVVKFLLRFVQVEEGERESTMLRFTLVTAAE